VAEHPLRKRLLRLVVPATAATVVTGVVVGVAVGLPGHALGGLDGRDVAADVHRPMTTDLGSSQPSTSPYLATRSTAVSRSAKRVTLKAMPKVKDRKYMTAALNLWPDPAEKGKPLDVLTKGDKVAVTGVVQKGFAQIVYDDQVRWVSAEYLSDQKPVDPAPTDTSSSSSDGGSAGVSFAPCPDGSSTESGLTSGAVRLYRAVCNAFPALTSYGGYDPHGEHSSGKAIDFMINGDSGLGQAIADWARAHASELDLFDVIWAQHIWTPERASEGWRSMPDRGSATANHYDHVHISVN
jgi:hypothetical protein